MKIKTQHPVQPVIQDEHGVHRFKKNTIVEFLLDKGGYDLNKLAMMGFSDEDWEQFAQLIGYSVSGAGDLSYVSDRVANKGLRRSEKLSRALAKLKGESE
jgi:hypothetical protein